MTGLGFRVVQKGFRVYYIYSKMENQMENKMDTVIYIYVYI